MKYVKKRLDENTQDNIRISLSVRDLKLSHEPCCDFCGSLHPVYVYAAKRMSTGAPISCWRWCACESCSDSIDRDDWEAIEAKITAWLMRSPIARAGWPPRKLDLTIRYAIKNALGSFHRDACLADEEPEK